ncbi:MAG TPA: FAD-binding oxidoreductase [Myxococcota bacterium]|nr:FAD-binding oxidoreductase [Myxococcota bacterium]
MSQRDGDRRIHPEPPRRSARDAERLDGWGFSDSGFRIAQSGSVEMYGDRYDLAGSELPELLPWMSRAIGMQLEPSDRQPSHYPPAIPESRRSPAFLAELRKFVAEDAICDDAEVRLRHGHGHSQQEIYAIRHGVMSRVPDLVIFPGEAEHVEAIVAAALRHRVCLIPYGGGTNVSHALVCPSHEQRTIASIDLSRMNRVLWIDPGDRMACIEAGATGREIAQTLARHGFTLGHEPDSIEFSTLGGWIACHASGMKKNRYGNIEDLVLDVSAVTATGVLARSRVAPRESVGVDLRRWLYGSEGGLGIITHATLRVSPLPAVQRYQSVVFRSFEQGFDFLYDLKQNGIAPASVRLTDNLQFQFSRALKPAGTRATRLKGRLERLYVTRVRSFDADSMVACTLVFEGSAAEVDAQQSALFRIARRHGGLKAGPENGRRGYELTFAIAYIRDFAMDHYVLAESFETSIPWSRALALCERVKRRVRDEHAARGLPGIPFISCRITQLYDTGVCIYFYLAYFYKGVERPSEVFAELERAARAEVLAGGGSLSHHHGIGKLRAPFLPEILSAPALEWQRRIKQAIDPENVFGCANQALGGDALAG